MRKFFPSFLGLTLLLLPLPGEAQSLYDEMLSITEGEESAEEMELPVLDFALQITEEPLNTPDAIRNVMQQSSSFACTGAEAYAECLLKAEELRQAILSIQRLRSVGRDLQMIASSYEVGYDGMSGRNQPLSEGLPGVINIWQSGADEMTSPAAAAPVETETLDPIVLSQLEPIITELKRSVAITRALGNDRYAALIRRYQHGLSPVLLGEIPCEESGLDNT